ncbi:MAG: M81 family metallopeptidase [Candidatus Latescibacter sp.]|nr:M81 family metallopeptidase [Candidatus Latescibacter sp.]
MKRIMIGGMRHETNMFNPLPTGLEDFRVRELFYGDEIVSKRRGTNTETGGFIDALDRFGFEIVPSALGTAMPAGVVAEEVFDAILGPMFDILKRTPVDGILLSLHGAMVGANHDDGEGYILESIRKNIGDDIPIVITLDFHATLTPLMASTANSMVVYRTYPHMDMADRGREAGAILNRILRGEIHPLVAVSKQPLLIGPPLNVLPHDLPMKLVMDRARQMEREIPGVITACPAQGFMQQDVPYAGTGVAVTTDNDPELAQKLADELGDMMFAHRREYLVDLPGPVETIRLAMKAEKPPVAIADSGDNIGGGTPGDGTALLREILRQGVDSAFVPLWDPEAARHAAEAGVGATVTLEVGGKSDPLYGPPVRITGKVRTVTDGVYLNRAWGGYSAGVVDNMGLSVRIDMGGITIVLNSLATSPNNIMHAKSIGVYPEDYRMTVCKGGLAFREAYKPPVTNTYIQSDTPGYSSSNLNLFTFTKIRRPMFPLDDI